MALHRGLFYIFTVEKDLIMNAFEKVLYFLEAEMERPTNYGWFHLMFVGIVIISTIFLCLRFKDCDDKVFRRIALISWIIIVLLEIYKQVIYTFEYDGAVVTWDYQWYAFPYQLCSTPLYVLPFVAFLKDSKFRDAFVAYMAFFSLFGGLAVFFYPNDVFISTIGINIQTMIHHGSQVVLGIFFIVHSRHKLNIKFYLKSIPVFAALVAIAIIMNECGFGILTSKGMDDSFNMFYISRHFDCTLPILSEVYKAVPYLAFSLIYILGFAIISVIIYSVGMLIASLVERKKVKNA